MSPTGTIPARSDTSDAVSHPDAHEEVSLDPSAFRRTFRVAALRLPAKYCNSAVKQLQPHLLRLRHVKGIVKPEDGGDTHRLLLLATEVNEQHEDTAVELTDLPDDVKTFVHATNAQEDPTPAAEAEPPCSRVSLTTHQVHLDYASFSAEEVLRQVFAPLRLEAPTSFETVDHVAHLNLRDAHLPYKRLIAQVILDKNAPRIRTVVNKLGSIQTQYRTFPLEVLAGESDLNVSVREAGATFRFNFAEVYWNSRLSTEHARLVNAVVAHFHASRPRVPLASCVVWDVFAGVGPFAIPLGLRGCVVHANDLNPRSHHYLVDNIGRNKVGAYVTPYNRDGRDFLRERARQHQPVDHIIMNLPATALEFLDTFAAEREENAGEEEGRPRGLFDYLEARPIVHAYCFSKAEDPFAEALARASAILGCALVNGKNGVSVHRVRDVAPKKEMLCLSFPLPRHCELNFSRKRAMESEREKEGREDTVDMVQKRSKGVGDGT